MNRILALAAAMGLAGAILAGSELVHVVTLTGSTHPSTARSGGIPPAAITAAPASVAIPAVPPLILMQTPDGLVGAVDMNGTWQWSFKPAAVGLPPASQWFSAGPNVMTVANDQVLVLDRAAHVLGRGSLPSADMGIQMAAGPDGQQWAWVQTDSPANPEATDPSTPQSVQSVWVAGLGESPRKVRSFTEPGDTAVSIFLWSDSGLVIAEVPGACELYPQETRTWIMDPSSGRLTPLYGSDRHVTDLHRGVSAGIRSTYDPGTRVETNQVFVGYGVPERIITIPGVAAPDHLTDDALVSPDGAWIAASLTAEGGCGGVPEVRTAIVDTETGALHIITDFFAQAWVDSSHLAGYRETARTDPATGQQLPERDPHLLLADLGGTIVDLPKGTFLAVIAGTDAAPRLERPAR